MLPREETSRRSHTGRSACAASSASRLRGGAAPKTIRAGLGEAGDLAGVQALNAKASLLDEFGDVASDMATFESPLKQRFGALLPAADGNVGRKAMFEKQKLAARTEDVSESANSVSHAGDGAEREGADGGVHAGVGQRGFFSRETEKFQIKLGSARASMPGLGSSA